jgi:hypothetical protein
MDFTFSSLLTSKLQLPTSLTTNTNNSITTTTSTWKISPPPTPRIDQQSSSSSPPPIKSTNTKKQQEKFADDIKSYIVQFNPAINAARLKELAPKLVPRGPSIEVRFDGDGALGLHIVQVGKRVMVAACASGMEADKCQQVHFGDHVVRVGEVYTKALKMKDVKALIADAKRPVILELQPLGVKGGNGTPLKPPLTAGESPILWDLRSRIWALEDISKKFTEIVDARQLQRCVVAKPDGSFIVLVETEDGEGNRVISLRNRFIVELSLKETLDLLYERDNIPLNMLVIRVRATDARECSTCFRRGWAKALFCMYCGAKQGKNSSS